MLRYKTFEEEYSHSCAIKLRDEQKAELTSLTSEKLLY